MGLMEWLFGNPTPKPSPKRRVASNVKVPTGCVRNSQTFYEERGWRLRDNALHGWCRTRRGAVQARIDGPFGASPRYSLINPPKQLLNGPHGGCFRQKEANRFEVHWNSKPADVNAGILQLEHLLFEALR